MRVPLLVRVRCVGVAEDCGSSEGTVSNLRGVILKGERKIGIHLSEYRTVILAESTTLNMVFDYKK